MKFRQKSKKQRAAETITKTAKGAQKTVTDTGAYKAAKEAPTAVKALPVVAGVGAAGAVVVRKRRKPEAAAA